MQEPSRCWSLPGPAPAGCQPGSGMGGTHPRVRPWWVLGSGGRWYGAGERGGEELLVEAFGISQRGGHGTGTVSGSSCRLMSTPETGTTVPRAGTRCHGVRRVPHPALVR